MKATKFFLNSTEMADFAKEYRAPNKQNRHYFRTYLQCNHRMNEQRKAMVLTDNETIVQKLITCRVCYNAQNQSHEQSK